MGIRPIAVEIQHVEEHDALVSMATREYRTPAQQAAYLIVEGLRRAGYLDGCAPADRQTAAEDQYAGTRRGELVPA